MNRKFKFRIWFPEHKRFDIPQSNIVKPTKQEEIINITAHTFNLDGDIHGSFPIDKVPIIQQFTGLKDKNDKEVYEGDIIKSEFYDKPAGYVSYNELAAHYEIKDNTGNLEIGSALSLYNIGSSSYIVVGNIFENPNLIK